MRRLTNEGMKPNDAAMIEISLKLSELYAKLGEIEKAETGYTFCIEHAKANLDNFEKEYSRRISFKVTYRREIS